MKSFLTVNQVETALDLLLSQQLLINVPFIGSTGGALVNGENHVREFVDGENVNQSFK